MNKHIFIVRGAPGIGKTTLGILLRSKFTNGVIIDVDSIRRVVVSDRFEPFNDIPYIHSLTVVAEMVCTYHGFGYDPIIVIDVFASTLLTHFLNQLSGWSYDIINLIADDKILLARMAAREQGFVDLKLAASINDSIKGNVSSEQLFFDTTVLGPGEVLIAVTRFIRNRLRKEIEGAPSEPVY